MTAGRWCSVVASVAVYALLGVVISTAAKDEVTGRLVESTSTTDRPARTEVVAESTTTTVAEESSTTAAATTTTMPPRAQPAQLAPMGTGPLTGSVIAVDPGHNGQNFMYSDVGRAGSLEGDGLLCNTAGSTTEAGLSELHINWEVGTRLATLLRQQGAEVILTHGDNDGFGPCADERGAIGRDAGVAAFVSIHADGSAPGSSGFHVIFPAPKDTLDPAVVGESRRLAAAARDELVSIGGRPANYVGSNGVQERGDLANLNTANRPAILAELGNLKNATDAAMLSADLTYTQIARALARAVVRFVSLRAAGAALSADIDGNGWPDFLLGAPQLATTTTAPPPFQTTPTFAPPTEVPPTEVPPTEVPPTDVPPTEPAPTAPPSTVALVPG